MFRTFLENILYICYLVTLAYLGFNKISSIYIIDITPSIITSLTFFVNNTINFIEFYSNNITSSLYNTNLFDFFTLFFNQYNLQFNLIIVTFGVIIINVINSLYFSNKVYTLYNFLINLY